MVIPYSYSKITILILTAKPNLLPMVPIPWNFLVCSRLWGLCTQQLIRHMLPFLPTLGKQWCFQQHKPAVCNKVWNYSWISNSPPVSSRPCVFYGRFIARPDNSLQNYNAGFCSQDRGDICILQSAFIWQTHSERFCSAITTDCLIYRVKLTISLVRQLGKHN